MGLYRAASAAFLFKNHPMTKPYKYGEKQVNILIQVPKSIKEKIMAYIRKEKNKLLKK